MQTPLEAGRRPSFRLLRTIVHEVERALHKAVRWTLAIANNDLHKDRIRREAWIAPS